MSESITIFVAKQPVLIYENALGELIVIVIPDNSKTSLRNAISELTDIPKKFIKIKGNTAIVSEYERQFTFKLGYIKNYC
jgi:hypothetical protein